MVRVIKKWHRRMLGIAPSKRNQSGVAGVPKYARKKAHDVLDNMGGYPTSGIGLRTQPQTAHGFRERANTTRLTEFCGVVISTERNLLMATLNHIITLCKANAFANDYARTLYEHEKSYNLLRIRRHKGVKVLDALIRLPDTTPDFMSRLYSKALKGQLSHANTVKISMMYAVYGFEWNCLFTK